MAQCTHPKGGLSGQKSQRGHLLAGYDALGKMPIVSNLFPLLEKKENYSIFLGMLVE